MAKTPATPAPTRIRDLYSTRADLGGFIDPRLIVIREGFNVRDYRLKENRDHLDSLKEQIRTYGGVYKPLMVGYDGGQVILVDGESRLTAALELIKEGMKIETVPVQTVKTKDEAELLVLSMGSNGGKSFSVWELGIGYKRFINMGWTPVKIASTFGVSEKAVKQAVEAAELPMDARKLMSERAVSPALAISTIRKRGSEAGVKELKDKSTAAKAAGKKGPLKATKAPSKKEVAAAEWEKVGRKIHTSVEAILLGMENGGEKFEWIEVGTPLLKKLAALCNGTK